VTATSFDEARQRMVDAQIRRRGIRDARVLDVMERVPRERFAPADHLERAYGDHPLPLGFGQTISQPYMVAKMTELCALQGDERVLEIGAGSGYQTAILCELAREVFAIEIVAELAEQARARLAALGYANVQLECFDGSRGWAEHGPYDVILVAAGAPDIPPVLLHQLADFGRLIIPVGEREDQRLARVTRGAEAFATEWFTECRFVDLVGQYGWGGEGAAKA
jgi:protein-L-isoaspartate(D-aspartate) O-methyltransferase